jgi:hypothetical protein
MEDIKDERGRSIDIPFFRERFINEMGEADEILPIDEALVKKYEKIMPNELMYYWKTYGLTSFYNGLFWLTNPDDYKELVEQYLADTPLANREAYVIGRGAFGKLLIWEINKGETIWIRLFSNLVYLNAKEDRYTLVGEHNEYQMNRTIGIIEPSDMDQDDASNKPLFERALKKFGKLKSNEMYGMKLHESLGGKQSIRNIDKVDLFVYADIQLELEKPHFVVMDTEAMFS